MSIHLYNEKWFAVHVRSRSEKLAAAILANKGYKVLLPTYARQQRRSGDQSSAPLFPGYVFCRFDPLNRLPILVTPAVIAIVGRGRVPVPVEPIEIDAIQAMVSSRLPLAPWPYLEAGQKVRIEDHAFQGLEGILVSFKGGHRVVVSVSLLRRSVALEIDRIQVTPIRSHPNGGVDLLPSRELVTA